MPSTYTQNLGIEQPATGEQANVWGVTVNRNMATLDQAINGNTVITLSGTSYLLSTTPGVSGPIGAYPFIIWQGASSPAQVTIDPPTAQHLYLMSNRSSATVTFLLASGSTQFVLQPGYDAFIYADGASAVAGALASPQFTNVLVQGTLQVPTLAGNVTASGNFMVGGYLGVGAVPLVDPVTITGVGSGGQLRLALGNYGVMFYNDGTGFYLQVTASGNPYGGAAVSAFHLDLASGSWGFAGSPPSAAYALSVPSINTVSLAANGTVSATTVNAANLNAGVMAATGTLTLDVGATNNGGIDLNFGGGGVGIGSTRVSGGPNLQGLNFFTGGAIRMYLAPGGQLGIGVYPTQMLTVAGTIAITGAGNGVTFPDGTTQTTASVASVFALTPHFVTRNTGTLYPNNTGKVMFVGVSMYLPPNTEITAAVGTIASGVANSSLGLASNSNANAMSNYVYVFFPVPPGYQYQIVYSAAGPAQVINYATEWY